jgi:3-oxoisoapionate decarboxylase
MKLGIGSWTYPWSIGFAGYPLPIKPMQVADILYKAKKLEVDIVQICDNLLLHELSFLELQNIRKLADELNLTLQIGTRGVNPDNLLKYLEIAKVLKSNLVRTITDTPDCKPAADQVVAWIKQAVPEYVKAGISIAIENHDRFKVSELAQIINEIGSPNVGICLDTVNSFGALECPKEVVTELSPYVLNLHIKDFDITRIDNKMGFVVKGSPAGFGKLDIDMVFNALKVNGKNPDVILEQWTPFYETVEKTILLENSWAEKGIEFLKEKIKMSEGEYQNETC